MPKVLEAIDERMSKLFKRTHSPETVAITSKLKLFGDIKRTSDSRWKNLISGPTDSNGRRGIQRITWMDDILGTLTMN